MGMSNKKSSDHSENQTNAAPKPKRRRKNQKKIGLCKRSYGELQHPNQNTHGTRKTPCPGESPGLLAFVKLRAVSFDLFFCLLLSFPGPRAASPSCSPVVAVFWEWGRVSLQSQSTETGAPRVVCLFPHLKALASRPNKRWGQASEQLAGSPEGSRKVRGAVGDAALRCFRRFRNTGTTAEAATLWRQLHFPASKHKNQ